MSALPRGISEPHPGRLLLALADREITVTLEGGQICLRPSAAVTPELLAEVKAQKPALVALLRCVGARSGPQVLTPRGPCQLSCHAPAARLAALRARTPNPCPF